MLEILDLPAALLFLILLAGFLTGVLHGATGMAGGIVMAAILTQLIGIKAAFPVMTVTLLFSHASRVLLYAREADWPTAFWVLLFAAPTIAIGASVFAWLDPQLIALIMAVFLFASFPIKRYARKHELLVGRKLLAAASSLWGLLAGNVIGPGFVLAPFLLGTGMDRLKFVGTLAIIVLAMNMIKLAVFGVADLMNSQLFVLGAVVGLVTIPGNWLGKKFLTQVEDTDHQRYINIMTLLLACYFAYHFFTQ